MRLFTCFLVALAVLVPSSIGGRIPHFPLKYEPELLVKRSSVEIVEKWIDQRVDNFNPQNLATFEMRYYENDEFFSTDGPLFIYLGGEWTIHPSAIQGGHIYDMAEEFNASLFYTEHRYYGKSFPTENLNVTNLRFLTVEQALADVAHFIVQIKRQPRYANSEVIVVGGSYSATMAAWFRQLYPHLAIGAWASSAPVNAQVDFIEYKEVVGAAMNAHGSKACYNRLENAFAAAEDLIRQNNTAEFRELFGLCAGFGTEQDIQNAFSTFSDVLAGYVQYHYHNTIGVVCTRLLNTTTSPSTDLSEFARFFRQSLGLNGDTYCLDNYAESVEIFRNTSLLSLAAVTSNRQWFYQTCTEFGWYQTSGSEFQPFGSSFPVEFYTQLCTDVYGDTITHDIIHRQIDRKNVFFGEWNSAVRNVYFTNGLVDPWRTMSIQDDLNPSSPADVIPGAAHCQDLRSISERDSPKMVQVKKRIIALVHDWLGNEIDTPY